MDLWKRQEKDLATYERIAQEYVISFRDRYHRKSRYVRWFFRTSGTLVLGLSVTLPFLSARSFGHKDLVIGLIGVVIAFMAAARNFFHWDRVWQITRTTEFKLTQLIGLWETDIAKIDAGTGSDKELRKLARTHELIEAARPVVDAESRAYFATLSWPDDSSDEQAPPQGAPVTT